MRHSATKTALTGPSASCCLGCWGMWTLTRALNASLSTTTALSLRGGAAARLSNSSVHGWRTSWASAVLLAWLRNPHHRGKSLVLRDLHPRIAVCHAGCRRSLEIAIVGNLEVGLHIVCIHGIRIDATRCSIDRGLLGQTLLL